MVLCADGHRCGWNGNIRSNQSEDKRRFHFLHFVFFFLHERRERSQCFTNPTTRIIMMFFFFLLSIQCLRKHIGHAGSPHVALQMTFRAFSWETLTVQLFSLWTNCQTNSLFLQAKKKTGKYRFERSWIGKRFWSKVVNVQNSAWRLHKPPLLRSIKIYYLERRSGEYIQMISETSRLHCKHLNYSSKAVIVSSCYCTLCQIWLHENQRHERSKFNLKHWAGGSDALTRGEGAPARRCLE